MVFGGNAITWFSRTKSVLTGTRLQVQQAGAIQLPGRTLLMVVHGQVEPTAKSSVGILVWFELEDTTRIR